MRHKREWNEIIGVGRGVIVSEGPRQACFGRCTGQLFKFLGTVVLIGLGLLALIFFADPPLLWGLIRSVHF